jgi:hypothetical protein
MRQCPGKQRIAFPDSPAQKYQGRQHVEALEGHEDAQNIRFCPDKARHATIMVRAASFV